MPLSAQAPSQIIAATHTPYISPHPQRGTPYHRYVILLLPQPSATQPLQIPIVPESSRLGFNVREFMAEQSLDGSLGGGAHMWREVWNAEVSDIFTNILSESGATFKLHRGTDSSCFALQKFMSQGLGGYRKLIHMKRSNV